MYGRHRFPRAGGGMGFPGLTPMVQRLMVANGLVYLLDLSMGFQLSDFGAISIDGMLSGYLWQPFTYMWLHGNAIHLFFNMLTLWMFGGQLESLWGPRRFMRFYLTCGVGAAFVILLWNSLTLEHSIPTLGASAAVYGLLMAFSLTWPDRTIMLLFPPMPIRAIWFIPFLFLMTMATGGGENVSHAGHLGGALVALIALRGEAQRYLSLGGLRNRWHRFRMRKRLRAVRRDEWEKRKRDDDDEGRPTFH